MDISTIKTGDNLIINSKSFLSKGIRFFMHLLALKSGIKYSWIGSHSGTFVWLNDTLYIAESVDNGFHLREVSRHYDLDNGDYVIMAPVWEYDEAQTKELIRYIIELQTVNIAYQYLNFIEWVFYILFDINIFGKKLRRGIMYCYKSTMLIRNHMSIREYPVNITSFFDLFHDKRYYVKISHTK